MGNRKLWKTKNGKKIRIKDMTDEHLFNTVKMLEQQAKQRVSIMPCPTFQGEMAQFYAEQSYDRLVEDPTILLDDTIYEDLLKEAIDRGLYY